MKRFVFGIAVAAVCTLAAPKITTPGARHAAGYSSAVPQGARFVVIGKDLGPQEAVANDAYPLQTSLGGVSVKVTVGDAVVDAWVLQAGPASVVALLPSNVPAGTGTVKLTYNDESAETAIRVVAKSVGLYSTIGLAAQGIGQAAAKGADDMPVALNMPARPGQIVRLRASGFGPAAAGVDESAGSAAQDFDTGFEVRVGSAIATVQSAKRTDVAGTDEIAIEVPASAPRGCYVPLAVKVGDQWSNFVTLPVSDDAVCTSTRFGASTIDNLAAAGEVSTGDATLSRFAVSAQQGEFVTDSISGSFSRYKFEALANSGNGLDMPLGSCVVLKLEDFGDTSGLDTTASATPLSAGRLTLTGPKGTKSIANVKGDFSLELGQGINIPLPPGVPSLPGLPSSLYIDPGTYTLTGEGGDDVGPFSVQLPLNPVQWTNQSSFTTVPRSSDATLTWTGGGANDYIMVLGIATDAKAKSSATFICIGKASDRRLVVPSYILSNLPATTGEADTITLTSVSEPKTFSARGLDLGAFSALRATAVQTRYR
jgi:uncharacterized protein (TIGR03437 family)